MNTIHPSMPSERHRELIAVRAHERLVSQAARRRKATRLSDRAAGLLRRAAALVEDAGR